MMELVRNLEQGDIVFLKTGRHPTRHLVYANNGLQVLLQKEDDRTYFVILDIVTGYAGVDMSYCIFNKVCFWNDVLPKAQMIKQGERLVRLLIDKNNGQRTIEEELAYIT